MESRHSQAALQAWLITHISDLVGHEQNTIDIRMPFSSYGLSSKDAVILAGELEVWLKRQLSPTLMYEYPNIEALVQYLAQTPESNGNSVTQPALRLSGVNANRSTEAEPIAIIGIGCRFPGAENPQAFWQLLRNGVDAITEVPQERWDVSAFYDPDPMVPGKTSTRWGGFLKQIEQFDLSAFGITPREAVRMDPQQRLLLEVAWEALEDAGQVLDNLAGSQTGVFIGISTSDYGQFQFSDPNLSDSYAGTGNAFSIAANRLSYIFGFRGPSMAVDTACSSTLVATHLACNSLRHGECTLALVGGVNLILSPTLTVNFSKAGFMAPDGRCKTFDAEANGYVRSEGAGVVILKPLSQALTDGDPVYAVIRGSAVNQDGHSNGLTAPSRQAQESVLHQAYQRAGVLPSQIQYVEAHGTGTALGDPIEALALGTVLAIERAPDHKCALGSVKTNIGHLEAAAGIAGLIKVALSLKHREIPPSLHFKQPNPYIPFDVLPLYVQQELTPWPQGDQPAFAGVSSFGFGGTNAHVVLEEAPRIPQIPLDDEELEANQAHLLLLSARSPQALQALASKYQAFLAPQGPGTGLSLQDICYTASVRRTHHDHRLAVVGYSHAQLAEHLSTYLQGTPSPNISGGRILPSQQLKLIDKEETVQACLYSDKDEREALLKTLGDYYSLGYSINWTNLYLWGGQYVPLPTYAWQRERYWLEETGPGQQKTVMSISQASESALQGNEQQPVQKTKLIRLLEAASPGERRDLLIAHMQGEVAEVVGRDPEPQQGFFEMGMDSIMTIELKNRLQKSLGLSLSPTLAFDYPNISALATYLVRDMLSLESATPAAQVEPTRLVAEDPIAIIGLGCRFPGGANEPEAFWQILRNGVDGITEIPPQRWNVDEFYDPDPDAPKKMYTRYGGFLDTEVDKFDAKFFGIAPREAVSMDPQQRLLLEVSWEALENAGQVLDKLTGSKTGVFVGINTYDYLELIKADDSTNINAYAATGNTGSVAAGRLSYFLGLQGPCIALDTACSSSLVTVHLACQSLRKGECNMALAGGVNLMLSPGITIAMAKLRALSPDGHCKTFDASADGYGRGEGCGVVVLKRLADAVADGDPILALIRGSAINQDGRSSGLTVPNGPAQQTLIREALAMAQVEPYEVSYVDAHGTGTALGDPIELQALNAVLGQGHTKDHPLMVGSAKTNIGHLEAAAGVAGIIKVTLALQHEEIPPHLHLKEPSPYIPWDEIPMSIPTELTPWPAGNERRIAGVSSFGFGGTNAHVVLEEAPRIPQISLNNEERDADQAHVLLLSARSSQALRALASKYQTFLAPQGPGTGLPLQDICYTASVRRTHHDHRLAVVGHSHTQLVEHLTTYLQGTPSPNVASGRTPGRQPKLVFVFSGQGTQWLGMGRTLLQQEPVFRAALQECDKQLRQYTDWSILDELMAEPPYWRLQETELTQPVLFAFQVALVALWRSWGIKPDAVVGHSLGEVAAAYVAGILRLPDAVRVVFHRSRLMQRATGQGKMAQVELPLAQAEQVLAGYKDLLSVAAINSPTSTVISGEVFALEEVLQLLQWREIHCRLLDVNYASHSQQMEPLQSELVQALQGLDVQSATLPIFSTVTGQACTGEEYDASYWGRNMREPVRFAATIESLIKEEHKVFLEISPHPALTGAISHCLSHLDKEGTVLDCLRRDKGEHDTLLKTLGKCYSLGYPINWASIYHQRGHCVPLPTYAWQRERYWVEVKHAHASRSDILPEPHEHDVEQDRTNDWLYDVVWQPKTHVKPSHSSAQSQTDQYGKWLIFADQGGLGAELAVLLEKRGYGYSLVYPAEHYEVLATLGELSETDARSWRINPANPEDFQRLLRELLLIDEHPYHNVVYLWSLETAPPLETTLASLEDAQVLGCAGALHLVQALIKTAWHESPHLWLISRGVQPAGAGSKPLNVAQAPLWGIGKVIALEHPDLWGGLIDLDHDAGQPETQMLLAEILEPDGEDQVAFRREERYVSRLIRNNRLDISSEALLWRTDATYLITGGLGSLGLKMASWMVEQGVRHLMLTGRQGLPDRSTWETVQHDSEVAQKISAIQAMEARGATIHPLQVDATEPQQMAAALEPLGHAQPPLRGIIHAAGILQLQTIQEMDTNTLKSVLKPKAAGTWILHQLTQDMNLDFFVSFSSAASAWGSAQAGHYVAANHFLDIFAHYRHALGLPASSINWGWWENSNMVPPEGKKYFEAIGLNTIPQDRGLEALGHLIKANVVQKTVAAVNWSRYKAVFEVKRKRPFLELIETQSSNARDTPSAEGMQLMRHLEQTPPSQRLAVLVDYIRAAVAQVMGLDPSYTFEPEQGFFQLGMDSLMAIELKSSLETRLGYALPSTLAFEYPTIETIASYLANKVLLLNVYQSPNEELQEDPMSHQTKLDEAIAELEGSSEDDLISLLADELIKLDDRRSR